MGTPRFSGCRLVLDLEFGHRPVMFWSLDIVLL